MSDGWSARTIKRVNNVYICVGIFDEPLGGEVSDGPVDGVLVEEPTQRQVLPSKRIRPGVAALIGGMID